MHEVLLKSLELVRRNIELYISQIVKDIELTSITYADTKIIYMNWNMAEYDYLILEKLCFYHSKFITVITSLNDSHDITIVIFYGYLTIQALISYLAYHYILHYTISL